jgi:hypothetical protein
VSSPPAANQEPSGEKDNMKVVKAMKIMKGICWDSFMRFTIFTTFMFAFLYVLDSYQRPTRRPESNPGGRPIDLET